MENEINIEEIMSNIRKEIKEKGYKDDVLSFQDVTTTSVKELFSDVEEFNIFEYKELIAELENNKVISSIPDIKYKGLKQRIIAFVKKIIRKLILFYIVPIVEEQNEFNILVAEVMKQNVSLATEQEELKNRIEILEKQVKELEKSRKII